MDRRSARLFAAGFLSPPPILAAYLAFVGFAMNHQSDDAWGWLFGEDRVVVAILASTGLVLGGLGFVVARAWRRARPLAHVALASFVALVVFALAWVFVADGLRGAIPG